VIIGPPYPSTGKRVPHDHGHLRIDNLQQIAHISYMQPPSPHIEVVNFLGSAHSTALQGICRRYGVRRLSVFGSFLKSTRRLDSDLDLLAEFQPGRTPGFAYSRLAEELSSLFGVPVDLHTAGSLSRYFREAVLKEAREVYAVQE
jgi:uncharacterized protein